MTTKVIAVVFYRTESGAEPVRDWLLNCSQTDRKNIGTDIKTAEFGWPVGMPLAKKLGKWHLGNTLKSSTRAYFAGAFHGEGPANGAASRLHKKGPEDTDRGLIIGEKEKAAI